MSEVAVAGGPAEAAALEIDLSAAHPFPIEARLTLGGAPVALVGPNGAGKTTLLRMILGIVPARGTVRLGARNLAALPAEERRIGYVPQEAALFPHLSAVENVAFGLRGPSRTERALALLESLGAARLSPLRPAQLSGGERQRVALARALAPDPVALLLDEPLSSLDAASRQSVREFLATRLRGLRLPTLVVTHEADDASALADRLVALERGRVVQRGTLEEVRAAPATPFLAEFARTASVRG